MRSPSSVFFFSVLLTAALPACGSVDTVPTGSGGGGAGGSGTYVPFPNTCEPPSLSGPCDGEVVKCGNKTLDTCEICFSSDGGPVTCKDVTEPCDGSVSETCGGLGYPGGGEVICSPSCSFDVRDCNACVGSQNEVACALPRLDGFDVADIALAESEAGLAAAWISFDNYLHFATFSSDLEVKSQRADCTHIEGGFTIALSPTPGGWVVAVGEGGQNPNLHVFRLDAEGNELSPPRVIQDATYPHLVTRPSGAPFLVYAQTAFAASSAEVVAELLDETAEPVWSTIASDEVFGETIEASLADPSLLVTLRRANAGGSVDVQLIAVDEAGVAAAPRDLVDAIDVAMAPAGPSSAIGVWRSGESFVANWLDGQGQNIGAPIFIADKDPIKATQQLGVVVTAEGALIALVEEVDTKVSLFGVDRQGTLTLGRTAFATEPLKIAWLTAAPLAGDGAFAWTTYSADPASSRLSLARAKP